MWSYCILLPSSTSYFSKWPSKVCFWGCQFQNRTYNKSLETCKGLKLISLCNLQPRTQELCWRLLDTRLLAKTAQWPIQGDSILPWGRNTWPHPRVIRRTREILHRVFTRFSSKGAFCRKSPISTGSNDRYKPGKLPNLIWHVGVKPKQFSVSSLWYSGSRIFSEVGSFYWLTRNSLG